jgi:hypothetical protein
MDDLARQLVEAGAFRWETGMLTTGNLRLDLTDAHESKGAGWLPDLMPDLEDHATAALLAVQAMERGHAIAYTPMGGRWDWRVDRKWGTCDTLGEAAARALLAIHNGGTP